MAGRDSDRQTSPADGGSAAPLYPGLAELEAADRRIRPLVRRTPLERCGWLSELAGCAVYLKLECWQPTRSFKVRGALNALLLQQERARECGVVTASAGNHGQAVALAAAALGLPVTVFVPRTAPAVKRERIAALGATLDDSAADYDAAERAAEQHAGRTGALFVHPYSDPAVVAGQATAGLEILAELPETAEIIVPVGGGGLINGTGAAVRARGSDARVLGAQSERTPNMYQALRAGRLVDCPVLPTLADGLAGCTDERSLAAARQLVDDLVLVSEASIARAMRGHFLGDGVLVEGSGAVAAAALLERRFALRGPTVLIVTGGNVDAATYAAVLTEQ